MKCRCLDKNHPTYKNYGLRGIRIYQPWIDSYISFKTWAMSNGYKNYLELDRIDVNGNYVPDNCRWINHHEQTLNRRDTLYIQLNDKTYKLRDFLKAKGISVNSANGWRHENILEKKLAEKLGTDVRIIGGKKEVVKI